MVAAVGAGVPADFARVGARVMNHHYKGCGVCEHCRVGWSQLCRARHHRLRRDRARRARRTSEGAGVHHGPAARRALLRGGRGHLLRHRHRLRRARAHARPGATRSRCSARARSGSAPTCSANAMGARVIALDVIAERLALAEGLRRGCRDQLERRPIRSRRIKELTHGEGVQTTLDCTGVAGRARGRGAGARAPGARVASSARAVR